MNGLAFWFSNVVWCGVVFYDHGFLMGTVDTAYGNLLNVVLRNGRKTELLPYCLTHTWCETSFKFDCMLLWSWLSHNHYWEESINIERIIVSRQYLVLSATCPLQCKYDATWGLLFQLFNMQTCVLWLDEVRFTRPQKFVDEVDAPDISWAVAHVLGTGNDNRCSVKIVV